MADNEIALGVRPPTPPDIIGPISSLAQLQYLQNNAQRMGVETQGLAQQQGITQATFNAKQNYLSRIGSGETPESAIVNSGYSALDPTGADQALKNVQQQREISAVRNYDPNNPNSLQGGGPDLVQKGLAAQKSAGEITIQEAQLFGQLGTLMANDPSPQGRAQAAAFARSIPLGRSEEHTSELQSRPH